MKRFLKRIFLNIYTKQDVDDRLLEIERLVIQDDIPSSIFYEDMIRRLKFDRKETKTGCILAIKYFYCVIRLKKKWKPIFKKEKKFIPKHDHEFAYLIFSHPLYKDRETRDTRDRNAALEELKQQT